MCNVSISRVERGSTEQRGGRTIRFKPMRTLEPVEAIIIVLGSMLVGGLFVIIGLLYGGVV